MSEVHLSVPQDSEVPTGIMTLIRAFGGTDFSRVQELASYLNASIENGISYVLIGELISQIVGIGALSSYGRLGWVGFMGVDPKFQRRGIGGLMLRHLLEYAEKRGIGTVKLDATEAGKGLYLKCGFKEEYSVSVCEIQGIQEEFTDSSKPRVLSGILPQWVLKYDLDAFGADRGALLELLVKRGASVFESEGMGYGIVYDGTIGPLIARSARIALDIAVSALNTGVRKISIPYHSKLSEDFISSLVLKEQSRCTRMILGPKMHEDLSQHYAFHRYAMG